MTTEHIRDKLEHHINAALMRAPGGSLFPEDLVGLYRRTARDCAVPVEVVKEVAAQEMKGAWRHKVVQKLMIQ